MKPTSLLILSGVAIVFTLLLGSVLAQRFWFPREISSIEAVLEGDSFIVGTPIGGIVNSVDVSLGDTIAAGTVLFTVLPRSESFLNGDELIAVRAERGGTVTDIVVTVGSFIKPNDTLAIINDLSARALTVSARMSVAPEDLHHVEVSVPASVSAPSLNGGNPLPAIIVAVDPVYDGPGKSVDIKLQIVKFPSDMESVRAGVPLKVAVTIENQNALKNFFQYLSGLMIDNSNAEE